MKNKIIILMICISTFQLSSQEVSLIKIKNDSFQMGNASIKKSSPVHLVKLDSFYVSSDLVTRGDYESVFRTPFLGDAEDQKNYVLPEEKAIKPATDISWVKAISYCNKLSEMNGFNLYYNIPEKSWDPKEISINKNANGYRLLTEAEWEYLCKNKDNFKKISNLDAQYYEWVWDGFISYTKDSKTNPIDLSGTYNRVIRGGKYYERLSAPASDRHRFGSETSFRLAKNINHN